MHRHQVAIEHKQLGIPNSKICQDAAVWTPETVARLGTEPDKKIAADVGIPVYRVSNCRHRHRIAIQTPFKKRGKKSVSWTSDVIARMGQEPESTLAKELGLSRQAVAMYRDRCGIPAFNSRSR